MKFSVTALVVAALLLPASSIWAATEIFKGFEFEDQPLAPYVSAAVSVDGLGSLVVNSALKDDGTQASKTEWLPRMPGNVAISESYGVAKLLAAGPFSAVHTKVFDPRTTGQHGWAVLLKDDAGKWLDFGCRYTSGVGTVYARQYDGTTWLTAVGIDDRQSGDKYYSLDFAQQADGAIGISSVETIVSSGATNTVNWTTTLLYGNITEVYLSASSSNRTGMNYKYTEFSATAVPEPGSILALGCAVSGFAGYVIRRRRA